MHIHVTEVANNVKSTMEAWSGKRDSVSYSNTGLLPLQLSTIICHTQNEEP